MAEGLRARLSDLDPISRTPYGPAANKGRIKRPDIRQYLTRLPPLGSETGLAHLGASTYGHFSEPDGQSLSYAAASDSTVATVRMQHAAVTVIAVAKGMTPVTIVATDPGGLSATQSFSVRVPNRGPVPEGTVAARTVEAGDSVTLDMSGFFSDPDGDSLTYAAVTSDSAVATVTVSDAQVTIVANAKGEVTVTVTASDDEGLTATQSLAVRVPNRPPATAGAIPALEVDAGESRMVVVSPFFSDPDGDFLTYTAAASDTSVAAVAVLGDTLTVMANAKGTVTITVSATDTEGLSATQDFTVTVPNRGPVPVGTMPARTIEVDDADSLAIDAFFADPDGDTLAFRATTSDATVALAAVTNATLTIAAVAKGEATVTVSATDPEGLAANQAFLVTVPNRPPITVGTIADRTLDAGKEASVTVSPFFRDPDGDELRYEVSVTKDAVAEVEVSANVVVVRAVARGTATVTVTASDAGGLTASLEFKVRVRRFRGGGSGANRPPVVTSNIPSQTMSPGDTRSWDPDNLFSDPDGDELELGASTSDDGVATARLSGGQVVVGAVAEGTATVTVTASDPGGLTASLEFSVRVRRSGGGNRSPFVKSNIPSQTMSPDDTRSWNPDDHFGDPDGDALDFGVSTSDDGVATAELSGGQVVVGAVAEGTATVTVTASDPGGLEASLEFSVRVQQSGGSNRRPYVVSGIAPIRLHVGAEAGWNLDGLFADPDGDPLTYGARSSNESVATAGTGTSFVNVVAVAPGSAIITVTASDPGGLTASFAFRFTVTGPVSQNLPPTIIDTIPSMTLNMRQTYETYLSNHFHDPDGVDGGKAMTYDVAVADDGVVYTYLGIRSDFLVQAEGEGATTVTITARDYDALTTTMEFDVTVNGPFNLAPVVTRTIPDQAVEVDEEIRPVDNLNDYFSDPNDDVLSYRVTNSNPKVLNLATHTLANREPVFHVLGLLPGTATLTVTASDYYGLAVSQDVVVTVTAAGRSSRPR